MGGITPIETKWIPSDSFFQLSLTGNLGKVMKNKDKSVDDAISAALGHDGQLHDSRSEKLRKTD